MNSNSFSVDTTINADAMEMAIEAMFKIYSFPHSAMIREYLANAIDEHVTRGVTSPVEVNWAYVGIRDGLATYQIAITDHGGGMSPEVLSEVYTQIRMSGKRDDENTTGGFGIGAKVGLAVSDEGFDVLTSTGEQAAILRCRHVSQGRIRNDIDVIDADGIPQGTTVKATFTATNDQSSDMMLMLMSMALASDVKVRLTNIHCSDALYAPYIIEGSVDGSGEVTVYPRGLLDGTHTPASTTYLATIAATRAYRAQGLLPLTHDADRYSYTGDQFSSANVVYLNNTPYPLRYNNMCSVSSLRFGILDIPLEGVSVPRHREAINGVDTDMLSRRAGAAHDAVIAYFAAEFGDEIVSGYADYRRKSEFDPTVFVTYLLARSVEPSLTISEFHSESRNSALVTSIAEEVVRTVIDERTEAAAGECSGLVIYSSPKAHREAEGVFDRYPLEYVTDVTSRLVNQTSGRYNTAEPSAVILVPDMPLEASLTKTEVNRIRHNLKRSFPRTFLEARAAIIVRPVPEHIVSLSMLRRYSGHTSLRTAPAELDENNVRTTPAPYSGETTWSELSSKIVRNAAASARRYIEITVDPTDLTLTHGEVDLSLDEVREQLTAGDVLFHTSSRKLAQREKGNNASAATSILNGLKGVGKPWFSPLKHARFLAWNGIERVYLYADDSSATVARKEITNELMVRLDEMDEARSDYADYLDEIASEEVMRFKNCFTMAYIARSMGVPDPRRIMVGVLSGYEAVGVRAGYAVATVLNRGNEYAEMISSQAATMLNHRGPLGDVSTLAGERMLAHVLKAEGTYDQLAKLRVTGGDYKVRPPRLMEEITKAGGIDELNDKLDKLTLRGYPTTSSASDIDPDSEMFGEIKSSVDTAISDARDQVAAMVSMLSGGEVTLQQIESAARAEYTAYQDEKAAEEAAERV